MKKVSLSGSTRSNVGKKDASDLRKAGQVPCVVYGGTEQISFSALENDLKKIVWNPNVYNVELTLNGDKKMNTIIKDVQFHPVTDRLVHIDFLELVPNKAVKVKLPVRLIGSAEGVKKGGKLVQNYRKVTVMGVPEKLPDAIEINVEALNIGDMIRVKQVSMEGIRLLEVPESVIAAVQTTRNVAADDKAAAAATAAKK